MHLCEKKSTIVITTREKKVNFYPPLFMICNNIPVKSIFAFLYKVSHFFCSLSYYQYLLSSIKSTELTQNRFIDTNIEKNQRHGINKNYLPKKPQFFVIF